MKNKKQKIQNEKFNTKHEAWIMKNGKRKTKNEKQKQKSKNEKQKNEKWIIKNGKQKIKG